MSEARSGFAQQRNQLLSALPVAVQTRIFPRLELLPLKVGEVLAEPGETVRHAYFPTDSVVALMSLMNDGGQGANSLIGNEGIVGVTLVMGGGSSLHRAVVQCRGHAFRLRLDHLSEEFERVGGRRAGILQKLLLRYNQALTMQIAQTAACNQHHTTRQQLCRWLLMFLDRLPGDTLAMTHEALAGVLGVRREGVTLAAEHLQQAGIIACRRGEITVLDRPGLERLCCECFIVVREESRRLQAQPFAG